MNHYKALILCITLTASSLCQNSLTDINPKTFFKPSLNRANRARTGIILRTAKSMPPMSQLNNPFLSRNNFGQVSLSKSFQITIQNQRHTPNFHGKIELVPLPPGFYEVEWMDSELQRTSFMPIQSSEIWLMEFLIMGNYAHLPSVLVGKSILKSLPNPEFNQLHSELNRIVSILKAIVNQTFDPGEYIADSYVDELGGREDFVEYLRIQLKNWQEISFSSGEYLSSKDLSRLYLNGHLIQKELKSKYFFIRLDLLEGFQVRRFELISDGKENDS